MNKKQELKEGEFAFHPRGIGNNWLPCFICGHKPLQVCQADLAAFVDQGLVKVMQRSQTGHDIEVTPLVTHPVTDMIWAERFLATLDYREREPDWLQVKLGACGEHEPNLELLLHLTSDGNKISAEILRRCLPKRKLP